jgi:hypothetical protein
LLHPQSQISPERRRGHSAIGRSITLPSFGDDSAIDLQEQLPTKQRDKRGGGQVGVALDNDDGWIEQDFPAFVVVEELSPTGLVPITIW